MSVEKIYDVPGDLAQRAYIDERKYDEMYHRSVSEPDAFWAEQAERLLTWITPWSKVSDCSYDPTQLHIRWFVGGKLNVAANCLDRHLETRGDQIAILWEGDDPTKDAKLSYRELHAKVCQLGNALKSRGVARGDRVCIYMPMIPEAAVAMLACARIGAVHSVVFGGFSPESLTASWIRIVVS
jgi:acetyl-CoA synthetase